MELKTCNILGLDILVTDMEKTVKSDRAEYRAAAGKIYLCGKCAHDRDGA